MPSASTSRSEKVLEVAKRIHEPLEGLFELAEVGPVTDARGVTRLALAYTRTHLFVAKTITEGNGKDEHRVAWAEVIDSCGGVLLDLGIAVLAAPTGAAFVVGAKAFIDGVQCGMAIELLTSAYQERESFYDSGAGAVMKMTVEIADLGLDVHSLWKSAKTLDRIRTLSKRTEDANRLVRLGNMQFVEATKAVVVHMPNVVFKTGNLLRGDKSVHLEDVPEVLNSAESSGHPPPLAGSTFGPLGVWPGSFPYPLLNPFLEKFEWFP